MSSCGLASAGVYCTAKQPRSPASDLLAKNYASATARDASHMGNYVRLDTDELSASYVGHGRDVWKVEGDVSLDDHRGYVAHRQSRASESSPSAFCGYSPSDDSHTQNDAYSTYLAQDSPVAALGTYRSHVDTGDFGDDGYYEDGDENGDDYGYDSYDGY